jgi:hypothetical protein
MPALDLGLARHPEHCGRKNPRRERDQGLRKPIQERVDGAYRSRRAGGWPRTAFGEMRHGCKSFGGSGLERFSTEWTHSVDKNSLNLKELEHVLTEKVIQLFRNML